MSAPQIHVGKSLKAAMARRRVSLKELSARLRVRRKVLRLVLRQRDVGLIKTLLIAEQLGIRIDVIIELTGYYSPGSHQNLKTFFEGRSCTS